MKARAVPRNHPYEPLRACREYVREVQDALGLDDIDQAESVADFVVAEIEAWAHDRLPAPTPTPIATTPRKES